MLEFVECRIGGETVFIFANGKLVKTMLKTNNRVNYLKQVAKMRRVYHGSIIDDQVNVTPTFVYALEEALDDLGYCNLLHKTMLELSLKQRYILCELLRDGQSIQYLIGKGITYKEAVFAIKQLFAKLAIKIRGKNETRF